jgi:hypothetical protein
VPPPSPVDPEPVSAAGWDNSAAAEKSPEAASQKRLTETTKTGLDIVTGFVDYMNQLSPQPEYLMQRVDAGKAVSLTMTIASNAGESSSPIDFAQKMAVDVGKDKVADFVGTIVTVETASPYAGLAAQVTTKVVLSFAGDVLGAVFRYAEVELGKVYVELDREIWNLYGAPRY